MESYEHLEGKPKTAYLWDAKLMGNWPVTTEYFPTLLQI